MKNYLSRFERTGVSLLKSIDFTSNHNGEGSYTTPTVQSTFVLTLFIFKAPNYVFARTLTERVVNNYFVFLFVCLRVEFLLKTDSGYPKDTGVNKPWQPLRIPFAISPIGQEIMSQHFHIW